MRYEEFPPTPALAPFVRCIWTFVAEGARAPAAPQRIVPDGRCELVVHLGDAYAEWMGHGVERVQPKVLFAGQLSRPLWLFAKGHAHILGVRFEPARARRFLGMPLSGTTDRRLDLESLWRAETRRLLEALDGARGAQSLRESLGRFVHERIERHPGGDDAVVAACVERIEAARGRIELEDLGSASGLGRRQLERRFREAVGLSPRRFANVLRLRSVFDALQAAPHAGWADAALAAGYFDQSHLIRDFRRFVGCTPAQFLADEFGIGVAIVQSPAATSA